MSHIGDLQELIRGKYGVASEHVGSVIIKEKGEGCHYWNGMVEVFALTGHPQARHAYAWEEPSKDPHRGSRFVAVLLLPPIRLPIDAVRAVREGHH